MSDYSTFVRIYVLRQIDNISGYPSLSITNIQNYERYFWRDTKILNDIYGEQSTIWTIF